MHVESAEVELAYTYAWWLTGDEHAARTAVLTAVDRPEVPGADPDLRVEILLRRVRAAAVATPTMCPASELALLHDGLGLALDSAAGLAMVDPREARTELAHGRLEALPPGSAVEVVEPHRLGGLAVGNPADVAAARQNPKLGELRQAILRGRDELSVMTRIPVPPDLVDVVAARAVEGPVPVEAVEPGWFDAAADAPPPADAPLDADAPPVEEAVAEPEGTAATPAAADLDDAEEIDVSGGLGRPSRRGGGDGDPRAPRRTGWLVLALAAVAAAVALLTTQVLRPAAGRPGEDPVAAAPAAPTADPVATSPVEGPAPDATASPATASPDPTAPEAPATSDGPSAAADRTPSPTPSEGAGAGASPGAEPTATGRPAGDDPVFAVRSTGVAVGIGGDPEPDNPSAGPFDPVAVTVEYEGAADGDALLVDWTVDDDAYDTERADLSPLLSTARFTKPVPEEGWPEGQHVLVLTLERTGEVVGEARFRVTS
jgi:hypothetical protein